MQGASFALFSLGNLATDFGVALAGLQQDQIVRVWSNTVFPRLILFLNQIFIQISQLFQVADLVIQPYIASESSNSWVLCMTKNLKRYMKTVRSLKFVIGYPSKFNSITPSSDSIYSTKVSMNTSIIDMNLTTSGPSLANSFSLIVCLYLR